MSKVYLHDEATGVTVESYNQQTVVRGLKDVSACYMSPAEFRAVIEGGLEWILSAYGAQLLDAEKLELQAAVAIIRGLNVREKGR